MPHIQANSPALWLPHFPFPTAASHKYTRGQALLYGGPVMTGAARLAARAAQRMGAGLITLAAPPEAVPVYAAALESVIVRPAPTLEAWQELLDDPKRTAVLIGPGMGLDNEARARVLATLSTRKPCVLDADALTAFAEAPQELFDALHENCVLTPHEGEFARLFPHAGDQKSDKPTRARQAAAQAGCTVLLKGAETVIASPSGDIILNTNAPPWLATAGAGDVLAGMITGLLAQTMPLPEAPAAAAWLHGKIASDFGPGLIAEDVVEGIPEALRGLVGWGE